LWKQPSGRGERRDHAQRRPDRGELGEQVLHGLADLLVGVEDDLAVVVDEADGQRERSSPRCAAASFAPCNRPVSRCSSASLMLPLRPSRRRSLTSDRS
jgi:hypothetical protein